jgi:hypothetical protein
MADTVLLPQAIPPVNPMFIADSTPLFHLNMMPTVPMPDVADFVI